MELNLGRIGPWLSDRLVLDGNQEGALALRESNDWLSRIVSWICSPERYSRENRDTVALFQKTLATAAGEARLHRVEARYGIDLAKMQETASPLLSRDVAKILTGLQVVTIQDIDELIGAAHGGEWPQGIDPELCDILREVENSEGLDKETFGRVFAALKNPLPSDCELPPFSAPIHGGMPTEALPCYYYDPFLTDRERNALCETLHETDFDSFVHDFVGRIIHRELDVGMLIPAPGEAQYYRVAAKIITAEGMVSYCLVPATQDTDLPPIRFYRGTCARIYGIDSSSSLITDLETDLGERAYRSGLQYEPVLENYFPPFEVQAGHSLGSTTLQKKLVEDATIRTAYLYNGPGITEREAERFNERISFDPDPVKLIIRDTAYDTVSLVGKHHLGYAAPDEAVDYRHTVPNLEARKKGAGYVHTTVWGRNTNNYGIEGVNRDEILDRKNANGSKEYLRETIGPFVAKIIRILRDFFRWIFGSRADEQKGIQVGHYVEGRWMVEHIRPRNAL